MTIKRVNYELAKTKIHEEARKELKAKMVFLAQLSMLVTIFIILGSTGVFASINNTWSIATLTVESVFIVVLVGGVIKTKYDLRKVRKTKEQLNHLLIIASEANESSMVKKQIKRGADINAQDSDGRTALIAAMSNNHRKMANSLIDDYKADISIGDHTGKNALHYAVLNDDCVAVERLLSMKIDLQKKDLQGKTPLEIAVSRPIPELKIIKALVENGANPNVTGGETPLHLAVFYEDWNLVKLLLEKEANPSAVNHIGKTAIHDAFRKNIPLEIVDSLAKIQYDFNVRPWEGKTALEMAVERGNIKLVEKLLVHGAKPNIVGKFQKTPLHRAAERGNLEMVELLLKAGANPNIEDTWGKKPLDLAKENGYEATYIFLQEFIF